MGVWKKVKKYANPVRAVKKTYNSVTGKDQRQKAAEQEQQAAAEKAKQDEQSSQIQRSEYGNGADASQLTGLGYEDAGNVGNGLTGLGGVSQDQLQLNKKRLLGQ